MKPPSASPALLSASHSPRCPALPGEGADACAQEWAEEAGRASAAAQAAGAEPHRLFTELRRKLAVGEALARAFAKLLEALRFTGRITFSFHQGKLTKTVLEEAYIRPNRMQRNGGDL